MNSHKSSHLIFSLSILLIFVLGSFFVLLFEVRGYTMFQKEISKQENIYIPVSYIQTKCRMNHNIEIENINNTQCLILNDDNTKTYIYCLNGKLKELYAVNDYAVDLLQGNDLFDINSFDIVEKDSLVEISISTNDSSQTIDVMRWNNE
jgi:hypothetical protein